MCIWSWNIWNIWDVLANFCIASEGRCWADIAGMLSCLKLLSYMVENLSFFNKVIFVSDVDRIYLKGTNFWCDILLWYFMCISILSPTSKITFLLFCLLKNHSDITGMRNKHLQECGSTLSLVAGDHCLRSSESELPCEITLFNYNLV